MNKKLFAGFLAFILLCACTFSAGAVCGRAFAADVILPMDEVILTSSEYETDAPDDPQPQTEDETVILYGAADAPGYTAPAAEVESETQSLVKPILICIGIGLVIALIAVLAVKSSYKPVRRKRDATEYLVDGSFRVTASDETFVRTERTERTIENRDASGSNT